MINVLLSVGHGPTFNVEGYYFLDLIVFGGLLGYLVRKPLAEFVEARRERILADIKEAQEMRAAAESKLLDYEGRLANLEQEIQQILNDAKVAGEEERKRILAEASKTADRIRTDAVERLEQERRKLEQLLQTKVVDMAISTAETLVKSSISTGDHSRFVDDYVSDLDAMQEGGR